LVPAARSVEAERGAVRRARERVLELVAVMEDLRLARDDLPQRRIGDAAEALKRIAHLRVLLLELHPVGEILETASSARGIVDAGRVDAVRARTHDAGRERLRVSALHLRHARTDAVSGKTAADEDDVAVDARDAVAAVGE